MLSLVVLVGVLGCEATAAAVEGGTRELPAHDHRSCHALHHEPHHAPPAHRLTHAPALLTPAGEGLARVHAPTATRAMLAQLQPGSRGLLAWILNMESVEDHADRNLLPDCYRQKNDLHRNHSTITTHSSDERSDEWNNISESDESGSVTSEEINVSNESSSPTLKSKQKKNQSGHDESSWTSDEYDSEHKFQSSELESNFQESKIKDNDFVIPEPEELNSSTLSLEPHGPNSLESVLHLKEFKSEEYDGSVLKSKVHSFESDSIESEQSFSDKSMFISEKLQSELYSSRGPSLEDTLLSFEKFKHEDILPKEYFLEDKTISLSQELESGISSLDESESIEKLEPKESESFLEKINANKSVIEELSLEENQSENEGSDQFKSFKLKKFNKHKKEPKPQESKTNLLLKIINNNEKPSFGKLSEKNTNAIESNHTNNFAGLKTVPVSKVMVRNVQQFAHFEGGGRTYLRCNVTHLRGFLKSMGTVTRCIYGYPTFGRTFKESGIIISPPMPNTKIYGLPNHLSKMEYISVVVRSSSEARVSALGRRLYVELLGAPRLSAYSVEIAERRSRSPKRP